MKARTTRRRLSCALLYGTFFTLLAGCNLLGPRPEREAKVPRGGGGPVDTSGMTAERIVGYLNGQADALQSISTQDLTIDVRSPAANVGLDGGSLLCQKPRYFRLIGKKFGSQEVLVGSNEERFWFYVKRAPQDALFHCSYTDFEKGSVELPFPFDPQWVLEAVGMARVPTDGSARMELDNKDKTVRLVQEATLHGQKVTKVTVCYQTRARNDVPQVKSRVVYDDRGKVICQATIKSVTRFPTGRSGAGEPATVEVPQVVKLEWPAQETSLELDLGKVRVNERLSMEAFQMPQLGSKQIDLARDRPTSRSGVRPAGYR